MSYLQQNSKIALHIVLLCAVFLPLVKRSLIWMSVTWMRLLKRCMFPNSNMDSKQHNRMLAVLPHWMMSQWSACWCYGMCECIWYTDNVQCTLVRVERLCWLFGCSHCRWNRIGLLLVVLLQAKQSKAKASKPTSKCMDEMCVVYIECKS